MPGTREVLASEVRIVEYVFWSFHPWNASLNSIFKWYDISPAFTAISMFEACWVVQLSGMRAGRPSVDVFLNTLAALAERP